MPSLPANFFARHDLRDLILRADALAGAVAVGELAGALRALVGAASRLDGILAALPPSGHRCDRAARAPFGWSERWAATACELHGGPAVRLVLERQLVGRETPWQWFETGRFRLTLGAETRAGTLGILYRLAEDYLDRHSIAAGSRHRCLSLLFPGVEQRIKECACEC